MTSTTRVMDLPSESLNDPGTWDAIRSILDVHGAGRLRGIAPTEEALIDIAARLGSLDLGVDQELSGPPVMSLRHDPAKESESDRPAYFTSGAFPLHTDLTYVPDPPRWLLTLGVESDRDGGGETLLADARLAWARLSPADREVLDRPLFSFRNAPRTGLGACPNLAVHDFWNGRDRWRFREDTLDGPTSGMAAAARLEEALGTVQARFLIGAEDLVIVDNHRVAHGRTGFQPGSRRHILRAYAQTRPTA